jgi:RES domain
VSGSGSAGAALLWRAFPWDPAAKATAQFSPSYLQPGQTSGRFDLHDRPPVRYLAESPDHAVGELLQGFRGGPIHAAHLKRHGLPLAIASVRLSPSLAARVADGTDPATLVRLQLRPDELAHHDRRITQAVARRLHDSGETGFRWWSALSGAWHSVILFTDHVNVGEISFDQPAILTLDHPALELATEVLGFQLK